MKTIAYIVYLVTGLIGLFYCLKIVAAAFGTFVAIIALFLAPFTLCIAPLYAGLQFGWWVPAYSAYGGPIAAFMIYGIGLLISGED